MSKVECLLKSSLSNIDKSGLLELKNEYFEFLKSNPFPVPPDNKDFSKMIHYFKRKNESNPTIIGPYQNITPFEAANRIASDLVIINGLLQLIGDQEPANSKVIVRLGTTHIKNKGDFTINDHEGEAFNVAESFLTQKLYKTKKKWEGKILKYILINADVFPNVKSKLPDKRIILVKKWDE